MGAIVSARSGETEDVTIVHLATGWGAKQLKVGSFTRSERMVKWNEGLRIADAIGDKKTVMMQNHGVTTLGETVADMRGAARRLRRAPAFTTSVSLTLALTLATGVTAF